MADGPLGLFGTLAQKRAVLEPSLERVSVATLPHKMADFPAKDYRFTTQTVTSLPADVSSLEFIKTFLMSFVSKELRCKETVFPRVRTLPLNPELSINQHLFFVPQVMCALTLCPRASLKQDLFPLIAAFR